MSSSSSPALQPAQKSAVQSFSYIEAGTSREALAASQGAANAASSPSALSEQEISQREQAAYQQGIRDGEERAHAFFDEQIDHLRDGLRAALGEFAAERASYYQRVEGEVVQLALSIARKVLHREAQTDPLLLAAIVRVALDKIGSNTKVRVRVNPQHVAEWLNYFHRYAGSHEVPEILEDTTLPPDHCMLETALGTTELGIDVQLKEIEQGLMDLLAQRPKPQ